jgi:hypothetical protein
MFVENGQANKDICKQNRGTCPSHCAGDEKLLFCSRGNITRTVEKRGCKCGMCPVVITHMLDGAYFCVHGNLDTLID